MAKDYSIDIIGQPYFGESNDRAFTVYFSEPESGVTEETGLCLLVAGFGGNAESNVYKKMRREFADKKNYVVVQCNYFGWEFMGDGKTEQIRKLMLLENFFEPQEISCIENGDLDLIGDNVRARVFHLEESRECFCEMGIIQAIDNLRAVKVVLDILELNNLQCNKRKIIAYGHSHGAYLAYLCNALNPDLFSCIIDNSAWVYPVYFSKERDFWNIIGNENANKILLYIGKMQYMGSVWIDDMTIYDLEKVYQQIENKAQVISFHGEKDNLVLLEEKQRFLLKVKNSMLYSIFEEDIDNEIFKNTDHGLGVDFLELFYHAEGMLSERGTMPEELWNPHTLCSEKYIYSVGLVDGVPEISRRKKEK